jgi:mutator protein MutT
MIQRVVAAVIQRGADYLVCLRPPHKRHGGLWEFPGGKSERGESDFDAVKRELAEELQVETTDVGQALLELHDPGSPFLIAFVPTSIAGEPSAIEHSEIRWVPLDLLDSLPLAPSDAAFVQNLKRHGMGVS